MSLEPIGVATILIGIYCLIAGTYTTLVGLSVASIFSAAAAITVGSANIQPAYVLLGFLAIGVITRPHQARAFVQTLRFGEPGFWLAALVIYGIASAYFIPRLLEGQTQIVPLGATVYGESRSTVPLVAVSSNLTQSIYMTGDLICFAVTMAVASTYRGFNALVTGVLACCVMIVVFAFIDILTFSTGTQFLLGFMRNAQYVLHFDDQVAGLRRIVGSFTETSQFARTELGVIAFCGTLWLCGRRSYLTGLTAVISLILVVLSTSSTGLACAPIVLLLLYGTALSLNGRTKIRHTLTAATIFFPMIVIVAGLWVATDPFLSGIVYDYADKIVLGKATSDSGIERNSFNVFAYQNFMDSYGFGVGLGTARTSSIFIALLANVGIPGMFFYLAFLYTTFVKRPANTGSFVADLRLAARNGCIGLIFGDALGSPAIDQGVMFYVLAALAAAQPGLNPAASTNTAFSWSSATRLQPRLGIENASRRTHTQERSRFQLKSSEVHYDGPFGLLRSTLIVALNNKFKLVSCVVVGLGIALIYANSLPRMYTATSTLLLETDLSGPQGFDTNRVDGELQKLLSERLLTAVFDALDVEANPEFSKPQVDKGSSVLGVGSLFATGHIAKYLTDLVSSSQRKGGDQALEKDPLAPSEAKPDARQFALEEFMSRVAARRLGHSYALEVSFSSVDAIFSAKVANAVVSSYVLQSVGSKLQSETAGGETMKFRLMALAAQVDEATKAVATGTYSVHPTPDAEARVIGAALTPVEPSAPKTWLITTLGGMVGLLVGSTTIALGTAMKRRVRIAGSLSRHVGLECLGALPDLAQGRNCVWSLWSGREDQTRRFELALRDIRTRIDIACDPTRSGRPFVLAIAGGSVQDGRSSLGANLARSISRSGRKVTIFKTKGDDTSVPLDAGSSSAISLADSLVKNKNQDKGLFEQGESEGTTVLSLHSSNPDINLFADFRDRRVGTLVNEARSRGDVILELPPLTDSTAALALATHADAIVIMVSDRQKTTEKAVDTIRQLQRSGANIIGTVISHGDQP